jgi:transcriptional regulator with XRE-family HTH domain
MKPGQKIQQLRKRQGLSLRALAKQAGVSVAYLSKLERDESSPTVDFLAQIAEALDVPVDELVGPTSAEHEPELPESLEAFIARHKEEYPELDAPEWKHALRRVRMRGKYPDSSSEWLHIFLSMRNAFEKR